MTPFSVKAILHTQRITKEGKHQLRIRVIINRIASYQSAGISLLPEHWDGNQVTGHPHKDLLNQAIRKKITEIERELLQSHITGQDVKTLKKNNHLTFNEYAVHKIKDETGKLSPHTISQKNSELAKFNSFSPGIKLKDLTHDTLVKYENYCRAKGNKGAKGNNENTVWAAMKFVKNILNLAVSDKIFPVSPAAGYKGAKYTDPFRHTLSSRELKLFEDFANDNSKPKELLNVANWFIFSCYCGLRYGDMKRFKGFQDGKISIQTEKTKEIVSFYATKQIKEAYSRITGGICSNRTIGNVLRRICKLIEIDKKVTFHTARHTFAVQFLNRGGRLELLQEIMGHSEIATTAIYAKISNKMIDDEMKRVWNEPVLPQSEDKQLYAV